MYKLCASPVALNSASKETWFLTCPTRFQWPERLLLLHPPFPTHPTWTLPSSNMICSPTMFFHDKAQLAFLALPFFVNNWHAFIQRSRANLNVSIFRDTPPSSYKSNSLLPTPCSHANPATLPFCNFLFPCPHLPPTATLDYITPSTTWTTQYSFLYTPCQAQSRKWPQVNVISQ